jgi:hypothetical protein
MMVGESRSFNMSFGIAEVAGKNGQGNATDQLDIERVPIRNDRKEVKYGTQIDEKRSGAAGFAAIFASLGRRFSI